MAGVLIPLAIVAFLAVLIAMGVFVATRMRSGESLGLSFRTIFTAYVYLMSVASVLVFTSGLAIGLKALSSDVFGRDFSYYVAYARPMPAEMPPTPDAKPVPSPAEDRANALKEADRQHKNDLIQGGTFVFVGVLLWVLHRPGRRREPGDAIGAFFSKAYSAVLLIIFGIAGVVSLTGGVYETLQYALVVPDQFDGRPRPGESLSTALVFVPTWIYFLMVVRRRTREESAVLGQSTG